MSSLMRGSYTHNRQDQVVVIAAANKLEELSSCCEKEFVVYDGTASPSSNLTHDLSQSDSDESHDVPELKPGRDIQAIAIVYTGKPGIIEPTTGVAYPTGLNQYKLIGCGVRTKYMVVHAYAVGLYLDVEPSVWEKVKTEEDIQDLLLNPDHPKVFRIVMNRNVTSSQYIGAIYDALTPLMRGQDMDKLEEMKKQEMPKMLDTGMEIFLMVKGNKLIMQLGMDRAGEIESLVLTSALCENYCGDKPVSPALKKAVMTELERLQSAITY